MPFANVRKIPFEKLDLELQKELCDIISRRREDLKIQIYWGPSTNGEENWVNSDSTQLTKGVVYRVVEKQWFVTVDEHGIMTFGPDLPILQGCYKLIRVD